MGMEVWSWLWAQGRDLEDPGECSLVLFFVPLPLRPLDGLPPHLPDSLFFCQSGTAGG